MPSARSFHQAAWFFATNPLEVDASRWVERGFLLSGGWSETTGGLLADIWLFDLTNLGTAACPWVNLGTSGAGRASASLSWDPTRQRFLRLGGYTEGGAAEYADDGVYTATLPDLVAGLGWTVTTGAVPERTVTTSSIGDGESEAYPWPVLDCTPVARAAPCKWDGITSADIVSYLGSGGACGGSSGFDPQAYVAEWGLTAPSWADVDCASGLAPDNVWYIDACADDPYVQNGDESAWMAFDSATAPGLAEAASAFDPVSGTAWLQGGTTGCQGSCADWADVSWLDLTGVASLHLANDDVLLTVIDTTVSDNGEVRPGAVADSTVPPDTSYGRRAAAGAWVGVAWDFSAGQHTGTGWMTAVGGTRHQALGIGRQHEILCEDETGQDMNVRGYCVETSDTWLAAPPAYSSEAAGLLTGSMVISVLDPGGAWSDQGDGGARMHAATTWFGGDELLVWGGTDAGGARSDLFSWDTAGGGGSGVRTTYAASEPWGPREGGTAVYDPITRTAYLFGGANDTAVYTYARDANTSAEPALRSGSNTNIQEGTERGGTVDPLIHAALTTADGVAWTVGGSWEAELDCTTSDDCFLDELRFFAATEAATELATLVVTVTYDDRGESYTLVPYRLTPTGLGDAVVEVRLPRVLTDGNGVDVEVGWAAGVRDYTSWTDSQANDRSVASLAAYPLGKDSSSTPEDDRADLVVLTAPPVLPASIEGGGYGLTTTFSLPAGWQGVAAGEPDSPMQSFTTRAQPRRGSDSVSMASAALIADRTMPTTAGSVYLWRDSGLYLTPSAYSDYLTATSGSDRPEADLAWLEAELVPFTADPIQLLWLRQSEAEEAAGWADAGGAGGQAFPGLAVVLAADASGVPGSRTREITLHELTHELFLYRNLPAGEPTATGRWWEEGLARLVEHMRTGDPNSLTTAASSLAAAACTGFGDDLEVDGADALVAYEFGAYTAAQLYYTYLGAGGTPASFWTEVAAFHASIDEVDAVSLENFISTDLALPSFYAEWVQQDRIGTPLLSVTELAPDTTGCVDTGPCEPMNATLTLRQIQTQQLTRVNGCRDDAPLFTDVPWFLQCTAAFSGLRTFNECEADRTTLWSGTPRAMSAASEVIPLTVDPMMAPDAWPTRFRVLANDALLPGTVPASGWVGPATRTYLQCPRSFDADCGGDNDGDGWPLTADCEDADPIWNPTATPGPLAGADTNCDGW